MEYVFGFWFLVAFGAVEVWSDWFEYSGPIFV